MRTGRSVLVAVVATAVILLGVGGASADGKPGVALSKSEAGKGGEITVKGDGWRPKALLMLLICGEASPATGVPGGTNSCANADGRAVTTDADGRFTRKLEVAEPPKPCPCVVYVATVQGQQAAAYAEFTVAGHPVAPLPKPAPDAGRLAVMRSDVTLDGSGSLLTWFGAPQTRRVVLKLGNLGSAPVVDPVFQVGTSHGVFSPLWEERQWRGTLAPGKEAEVALDVQLPAGAYGDYLVSVKYGKTVMAAQPWGVDRPWGVVLFWVLLAVVVPAGLFRIGLAVVDRVRPRTPARHRTVRQKESGAGFSVRPGGAGSAEDAAEQDGEPTAVLPLPWFTPDSAPTPPPAPPPPTFPHKQPPGAAYEHAQVSAPHESTANSPTPKGNS
ncbi:hypothetical protein GCM10010329_75440 [Streptomyces spiroverticillatus]|uniref:Uncharacterized protein n=1 Tax=Streptomyces finlayi TaxID=67296 RepID=A0A918X7J8_9ACTN|nr:hypothetical protein [Streptomyces finlayi]GHA41290.1 hypothetical protein GCM10010329_75440 [Streptomyces spiroverticillatus]GHD16744.1 hypothetical protein GCM10010334_78040 [Streptomyces finlayi]